MKKLFLLLFIFISLKSLAQKEVYLFSYFKGNGEDGLHLAYSHDGLKWDTLNGGKSLLKPDVGKDKLMRDPCILQKPEGDFVMVWTSGWWDKGIGLATSSDLIHWSEQQFVPVMEHEPEAKNAWAPEIVWDSKHKQYLIFWATTIPGRHSEIKDSEREKGLNHRMYYTTTKDFKTFKPTKLFFNPDFSVIDATIIKKGRTYYMILKNENPNPPEKNLRVTTSDKIDGPYPVAVSKPITGNYWAEGPTAIQIGKYVYVYFDKYTQKKYGVIRSDDMQNWEDISDKLQVPKGLRHGTVFKVSGKLFETLKKL
jgi:beta-galactosidase